MSLNVAYSCDEKYIPHTGISIISLLENNKDFHDITVYFIAKDVSQQSIDQITGIVRQYGRKIIVHSFNHLCNDLKITSVGRHVETIYAKLFFTRIEEINKILYIDSDTVINGSLRELWNIDISNYLIAGVETYTVEIKKLLGLNKSDCFINDGIVLMNLKKCRRENFLVMAMDCIAEYNGNPPLMSEGVINKICRNKILKLHPKFNLMSGLIEFRGNRFSMKGYYVSSVIKEAIQSPIIIHFLSAFYNRPWDINCTHPMKDIYKYYKSISTWKDMPMENKKLSKKLLAIKYLYKVVPHDLLDILQILKNGIKYKSLFS